jgi:hypothetical protein
LQPVLGVVKAIAFPASVALVAFMAVRAATDLHASGIEWSLMAPAAGVTAIWWLLLARGWALLHGGRVSRADIRMWCRTQALRYLPGGIWAPVSRVAQAQGAAIDRVSTVAAENIIALCASLAIGGTALGIVRNPVWFGLVGVAVLPFAVAPLTARRSRVDRDRALRTTVNDLVASAAYVTGAALVQRAISGPHDPVAVAGAAAVAWGAGLVVPFTPGGIGVREVVYIWLLTGYGFPRSELIGAAVLSRLVTIVVELVVLVLAGRESRAEARKRSQLRPHG